MGKRELLRRYGVHPLKWRGKKKINNEHGSKSHDFFESSVI